MALLKNKGNKLKNIILVAGLFLVSWNYSYAITIDFNSLESSFSGANFVGSVYTEESYVLQHGSSIAENAFETWGSGSSNYTGSASLFNNTHRGETILTQQNSSLFSMISIDLASFDLNLSTGDFIASESVLFVGTKSDATTVEQIFNLGTAVNVMNTYTFNLSFTDLTSLSWDQGSILGTRHQFDNVEIQAIPLPGSMFLFLTGLIGIFSIAKNKLLIKN